MFDNTGAKLRVLLGVGSTNDKAKVEVGKVKDIAKSRVKEAGAVINERINQLAAATNYIADQFLTSSDFFSSTTSLGYSESGLSSTKTDKAAHYSHGKRKKRSPEAEAIYKKYRGEDKGSSK